VYGDSFSCGLDTGDLADSIHQSLPMVRASAAHECSIDIEQN
jgi:hypothetical protein